MEWCQGRLLREILAEGPIPHDRSIRIAMRKRPIAEDRIDRIVNGIVRQLEASGDAEIPTAMIGGLVMDTLKDVDEVAYVRFASVYRDFREARDFENFLGGLEDEPLHDPPEDNV